jgi:hypothetical protein
VLVQQCLAKDPEARWQCADDVARGLRLAETATGHVADSVKPAAPRWRWALAASLLALAAAAATAALVARRPPTARPLRFAVMPEPGVLLAQPTAATPFAVSPDGRRIAFVANAGGTSSLWLWSAQDGQSHKLEDDDRRRLALLLPRRPRGRVLHGRRAQARAVRRRAGDDHRVG